MSLKLLLNFLITLLLLLIMMIGLMLMLDNAREDVRAETESTANLTLHMLDTEIIYFSSGSAVNAWPESPFRLNSLGYVRHLRVEYFDAHGHLRDSNRGALSASEQAPPGWFVRMMMKAISPEIVPTRKPVFYMGRILGELVVTPDPSSEIREIWSDTLGLIELVAVFFVLVNVMVYWAVGRALRPVNRILAALTELESGRLDARLPAFRLPELAPISTKFNGMAQTLQQSVGHVHELNRKIVCLQEDERRSLARDLHDEIGQCLTAIHVDATAVMNARRLPDTRESAQAILKVTQQMMKMLHDMLQRLRPSVLDELGLRAALNDLVDIWQQRNRGVACTVSIADELDDDMDEHIAITAYRIVQESLTNISRHAAATAVVLDVTKAQDVLAIYVEDNGLGFDSAGMASGYGLTGMRERIEGLGGEFVLQTSPGKGARISVRIPINVEKLK